MHRVIAVLAVVAVLAPQMLSGAAYGQTDVPRRYVVVFAAEAVPGNAGELIRAAGGELVTALPQVGVAIAVSHDLRFPTSLKRHGTVLAVSPERSRTVPDLAGGQAEAFSSEAVLPEQHLSQPTPADDLYDLFQWNIRRVRANEAWNTGATGSPHVVVAVIDNGVASNHPDLAPNLRFSACFSSPDFPCLPYPNISTIDGTHGTMVAGIIAAAFGNGRVVGVGPNLGLASYNVFEPAEGGGFEARDSSVWAAMLDAAERTIGQDRIRVINLSLGDYVIFPENEAATWAAWNRVVNSVVRDGVTVVASAGNDALNLNGNVAHIPSDLPQVISVGGTGIRPAGVYPDPAAFDVPGVYPNSKGTNIGAAIDLVAPGGDCGPTPTCQTAFTILSTAVMAARACAEATPPNCRTIYFRGLVGTSFAAPHVAGVAGLLLSMNPNLQPHQVRAILRRTASEILKPLGEEESEVQERQVFGHGMVDALEAVSAP